MSEVCAESDQELLLIPEAALASRLMRNSAIPVELFRWLAAPQRTMLVPSPDVKLDERQAANTVDPKLDIHPFEPDLAGETHRLMACIDDLIQPMRESATKWEKEQTVEAAFALAHLSQCIFEHCDQLHLEFTERLLATCWLPLYRSIATGELADGFEQSRFRFTETLCLLGLCDELGNEIRDLLEFSRSKDLSPHTSVVEQLSVDLVAQGFLVRGIAAGLDIDSRSLNTEAREFLKNACPIDVRRGSEQIPDWAHPEALWHLAGEFLSSNKCMFLPRSWIEDAIPWSSIAEHWEKLWKLLNPSQTSADDVSQADADKPTAFTNRKEELVLPKVLIAEINTPNDPAFVKLTKRQLATGRSEGRCVCLASTIVVPDNAKSRKALCGSRKSGIRPWQQKLVDVFADHPDLEDPYAFITSEGELLLCMLDIERVDVTNLIRKSMEMIFEKANATIAGASVLHQPPARYYSGVASVSSPNAGMAPEQLIEAACRCLSAASSQSSTLIKSIEVF